MAICGLALTPFHREFWNFNQFDSNIFLFLPFLYFVLHFFVITKNDRVEAQSIRKEIKTLPKAAV